MSKRYFKKYSDRQIKILSTWISRNKFIYENIISCKKEETSFHDAKILINANKNSDKDINKSESENVAEIYVEIKEEEFFWFSRTGNIGFDYISAFKFRNNQWKEKVYNEYKFWISKDNIVEFIENIEVLKWGKLKMCDADIQLFYVENEKGEVIFCEAYNNWLLQKNISHFEKNYNLRINKKSDYKLEDNWESAVYLLKPKDVEEYRIKNLSDLINCINMRPINHFTKKRGY